MALKRLAAVACLLMASSLNSLVQAQRLPVLQQIDLPHPYYFREMYLPQLTSGPSAVAWGPDSRELIYSMAGSLWRQRLDSTTAEQLAGSPGYDYQPDWSPDGRWVIFAAYVHDAVELWALDLQRGVAHAVLANGAVNLEPRFSPDGKRLVFVSTTFNRRFHVFTAGWNDGVLRDVERLTGETSSSLPRYYYSPYDHEISPSWSRAGDQIIYVSNRNHIYGTGGFWRTAAAANSAAGVAGAEFHYEETNWKAKPEVSPDGTRLVYSSYLGRQWHNLWLMPTGGGDAFPLSYGDWDQTMPRWSPDGMQIAFISNKSGNTSIDLIGMPGGAIHPLPVEERRYRQPMGTLQLTLTGAGGAAASARISVTDLSGRSYAPADAWVHSDDGFDRRERRDELHYFHARGTALLDVPAGTVRVDILQGLERAVQHATATIVAGMPTRLAVDLSSGRLAVPAPGRWVSADTHVHMNYGGVYRNTPAHLVLQAQAEGLTLVNSLIVNKEQRFPDIAYSGLQLDAASQPDALVIHGQEFHTSYWGHLGLLDPAGDVLLPGYVGYPNTAAASLLPMNADVADLAHARGALVGYVHPFDEYPEPIERPQQPLSNELPVDVALGKVDYMEILGFSDHRSTAAVWYRLLNLGFKIPAAGGTDAMANYASLRGPVGMNRVYVRIGDAPVEPRDWMSALQAGRSMATNGPLLGFTLGGAEVGDELAIERPKTRTAFVLRLRSIVAVEHLELVCNGVVVRTFGLRGKRTEADFSGSIPLSSSGWCLARAYGDAGRQPIMDIYPYATTSPIYVRLPGRALERRADADYFIAWIDRIREAVTAYPARDSAAEKSRILGRLADAQSVYASRRESPQ